MDKRDAAEARARDCAQLVSELRGSRLFCCDPARVEVRETHASVVFLTPTNVYKLKKPVDLGFLNYSTPKRRALMAAREVKLNRRLAPSVYLGVERLVWGENGSLRFSDRGTAIDYLVHMRRLPDEASLAALAARGEVATDDMQRLARKLAAFHETADPAPAGYGSAAQLGRNARENLDLAVAPASPLSQRMAGDLWASLLGFLRSHRAGLAARAAAGRIRDGHGDLRCEHVYFENDEIQVIDCIEFNARFRYEDVALDLAFLAMDLETAGFPRLADALVAEYERASGDWLGEWMPFYKAYRATVRCKVALVRASQLAPGSSDRESALLEAARYLYAAVRCSRNERSPRLIVVSGLTGTGKSTTARLLADVLPARVISADETRKRLSGVGPGQHPFSKADEGLYSPEMNRAVYGRLAEDARDALGRSEWIILDATYRRRADREHLRAVVRNLGVPILFIECQAPVEMVRHRLERREASGGDAWSDGTWETYRAQLETAEPFAAGEESSRLVLPTVLPPIEQVNLVLERLAYGV